jgi:hypothetical protein
MKSIKINNENFSLKSSFSEINEKEFLQICKLRSEFMEKKATMAEYNAIRIPIFILLSNLPERIYGKITAEQWADLLPHVDFAAKEIPDFTKNPLPIIEVGKYSLFGPVGLMDKCTAEEFTYIDTAFIRASNTKDVSALLQIFAYMYRPMRNDLPFFKSSSKWNGDFREEFNLEKCKSRIEDLKEIVPLPILVASFLYFQSVRKQKFERLKYLFQKTSSKIFMDDRGWAGSMLSLSHTGVFGSFADQMKMNWFTVMVEMDRLAEQTIKSQENR